MDIYKELYSFGIPKKTIEETSKDILLKTFAELTKQKHRKTIANIHPSDRLVAIANYLDIKGLTTIADDLENEFSKKAGQLLGRGIPDGTGPVGLGRGLGPGRGTGGGLGLMQGITPSIPPEEVFMEENILPEDIEDDTEEVIEDEPLEDESFEEIVAPADIENLLDKINSLMEAMGEDFDEDLLPALRKMADELSRKIDLIEISSTEEISEDDGTEEFDEDIEDELEKDIISPSLASRLANTIAGMLEYKELNDKTVKIINAMNRNAGKILGPGKRDGTGPSNECRTPGLRRKIKIDKGIPVCHLPIKKTKNTKKKKIKFSD